MRVMVITPTTGKDTVFKAMESVRDQTVKTEHLVVFDGQEARDKFPLAFIDGHTFLTLPENVGGNGWYGHRVYAAMPLMVNADYILFLDEDNWLDPNHIESLMEVINQGNQWAFSLRKIMDKDGNYVCNDDCESLGKWPSCLSDQDYFVDVGCYFLPKNIALQCTPLWYRKAREPGVPEVDRMLSHVLRQNRLTCDTNGEYTLNYRTGNTGLSVQKEFFLQGNEKMMNKYNGKLPWKKTS